MESSRALGGQCVVLFESQRRSQSLSSSCPVAPVIPLRPAASVLVQLRAGNTEAAGAFFDQYASSVERTVRSVLGPDAEVDDLVQDTFVAALRGIAGFRGDDRALGPWVKGIAVRLALKKLRWRRARRWLGGGGTDAVAEVVGTSDTETHAALRRAFALLERLPASERAAFGLRFLEGMRLEEVADGLGVSLATAKRRIRSARERFGRLAVDDVLLCDWLEKGGRK